MIAKSEAPSLAPSPIKPVPPSQTKISKRIQYAVEYTGVRLLAGFLCLLPRREALEAGRAVGRILGRLMVSRGELARKNILNSLPGISQAQADLLVKQCWENLGAGAAEFVTTPGMSREEIFSFSEMDGIERLRKSYAEGKGVLMVTAHYGAWELGAKVWPMSGFKTAVVARRVKNPLVNRFVTRIRCCEGVRVLLAHDAVRESIRWLKQGNLLAVLIDHRVTEGGLKIPFFGRPAATTSMPAILALRYGIPVHMVHSWREGDRVKIHIAPPLDLSDLTASEADIAQATRRMNAVVEAWVRERPEAWLWIHNRWKMESP